MKPAQRADTARPKDAAWALRTLEQRYHESDPGEANCPIGWYIEAQIGYHDHSRCAGVMAVQEMGRLLHNDGGESSPGSAATWDPTGPGGEA